MLGSIVMATTPSFGDSLDDVDGEILRELRTALDAADPMPADLDDTVQFALTVQALRAEIAELERLPADLAAVRSVDYTRASTVTFTSDSMSVVVTITSIDEQTSRIDGWVDGVAAEAELRSRQRTDTATVDEHGRFSFPSVERGMVQFVFRSSDDTAKPVITPAMEV